MVSMLPIEYLIPCQTIVAAELRQLYAGLQTAYSLMKKLRIYESNPLNFYNLNLYLNGAFWGTFRLKQRQKIDCLQLKLLWIPCICQKMSVAKQRVIQSHCTQVHFCIVAKTRVLCGCCLVFFFLYQFSLLLHFLIRKNLVLVF